MKALLHPFFDLPKHLLGVCLLSLLFVLDICLSMPCRHLLLSSGGTIYAFMLWSILPNDCIAVACPVFAPYCQCYVQRLYMCWWYYYRLPLVRYALGARGATVCYSLLCVLLMCLTDRSVDDVKLMACFLFLTEAMPLL